MDLGQAAQARKRQSKREQRRWGKLVGQKPNKQAITKRSQMMEARIKQKLGAL